MPGCSFFTRILLILSLPILILDSVAPVGFPAVGSSYRGFSLLGSALGQTVPSSESKSETQSTFTEMLRSRDQKQFEQQQQTQSAANYRTQYYGILPDKLPEGVDPQLAKDYELAFKAFRDSIAPVRELYLKHQVAWNGTDDLKRLSKFSAATTKTHQALKRWCEQMAKLYAADPSNFGGIGDLMEEMVLVDSASDRFESILPLAKVLMEKDSNHSDDLLMAIGFTGYAMNDFDLAVTAWTKLAQHKTLPGKLQYAIDRIPEMKVKWERELKFRETDTLASNNPQVQLTTNRGEILIELFEDQAPQAVASFIFLVERGFYKRKIFFRVSEHFAAQTGCERGDGTGNAGYGIPGEMNREDHRDIFRGSVFFAIGINDETKEPDLDSGSSQFLLSMMPQPHLDGTMTVFGRIIQGEQWLGNFSRMDLSDEEQRKNKSLNPDYLWDAKVVRKRDHNYVPEIVGGRLP